MKSGYSAGAVAGFVTGIAAILLGVAVQVFTYEVPLSTILELLPFTAAVHMGYNTLWGVIFGILYARFYDVIPGEGAKKALIYSLIFRGLATYLWITSYDVAHGNFPYARIWALSGIIVVIFYGPLLGMLCKVPKQTVRIEEKPKYNILIGIITGFIGGIIASILTYIWFIMEIPYPWSLKFSPITSITSTITIEFILAIVWGVIFSAMFVLLYARIPGKGIMKGIYFGLILCLISIIYTMSWTIPYPSPTESIVMVIITYCLVLIGYGLTLGIFYRK